MFTLPYYQCLIVKYGMVERENKVTGAGETQNGMTELVERLRHLPIESFTKARMIQPEDGCGGQCPNCSQFAQPDIWSLSKEGLVVVIKSIAAVAAEVSDVDRVGSPLVGYERKTRPDTIFPYLDNDIGSYPHLDLYLQLIDSELHTKAKITTIGWSRHNQHLQAMHERINRDHLHTLSAVTFSLTSYTQALRTPGSSTSPAEYEADLANALRTYKPAMDRLGTGKELGCVTLRFKPLVASYESDMDVTDIAGYHVIHTGPHLVICTEPGDIQEAQTDSVAGKLNFTRPSTRCVLLTSDRHIASGDWHSLAEGVVQNLSAGQAAGVASPDVHIEESEIYKLANPEGSYYALDPDFKSDGSFRGIYLYPKSDQRKRSGYNDSRRYFLNTLLEYKKSLGYSAGAAVPASTWADVDQVIQALRDNVASTSGYDTRAGSFISDEIIPLAETLARVLKMAGYGPEYFFDPGFAVDTGQILNQGRGIIDFRGLTGTQNLAINPQHERAISTWNGTSVWRWTVAPTEKPQITIQELDPATFTSDIGSDGRKLARFVVEMPEGSVTHIRGRENLVREKRIPGVVAFPPAMISS